MDFAIRMPSDVRSFQGGDLENEQMRHATDDESKGIEIINQFLDSMRIDLQKSRGLK